MRTCPACGEDTRAGYSEPCTECGFSAMGDQSPPPPPEPGRPAEPPADQPPPADEPQEQRRRSPRLLVWLVVIAAFLVVQRTGVFDEPTGPSAEEVEGAIADNAPRGLEVTVDCPDDAEDTPVDGTFTCTATAPGGRAVEIVVTNHGETFEWEVGPLTTLT